MVLNMKESGKIIQKMEKDYYNYLISLNMKVIFKTENLMVMVNIHFMMVKFIKDNGKMI